MKDLVAVFFAFTVLIGLARADNGTAGEDMVIEAYSGGPEIPDWVSYSHFLVMVNGGFHSDHIFGEAFDIRQDTIEGRSRIRFLESWFLESADAVDRERNASTYELLCSGNWQGMNLEQFIVGLEKLEPEVENIYQKEYDATVEQLSPSESRAFRSYLDESKLSTSYGDIDDRMYFEARGEEEFRTTHAATCNRLPAEWIQ